MEPQSPLETLLHGLLGDELRALGTELAPGAEHAAREELALALAARDGAEQRTSLRSTDVEHALQRSVRVAARLSGLAVEPRSTPDGSATATAWQTLRDLLDGEATRRDELIGQVLDEKYEIEALLAEGGSGKVYRARDRDLDCAVAIKVLKAESGAADALEALKAEARRLTRLKHPNIVEWKTLNEMDDGRLYLVMELLEGEVLESALKREGRLAPRRAARILLGVLEALEHAHHLPGGASLLHLDLKPTNVFLVRNARGEERVKVLDFGISCFAGQESRVQGPAGPAAGGLGATTRVRPALAGADTGDVRIACTPHYCPPELARRILGDGSGALDGRADLYSLGVMGFRMLTGHLPFESARDLPEMLRCHREVAAPSVASLGVSVPRRIARFVERCLAKDPDRRFADARAAHEALRAVVEPARSRTLVALAALAVVGSAAVYALVGTPGVARPLEVVSADTARRLADTPLFFGPARASHRVDLVDLDPGTELGRIRLVSEPRAGAAAVPGWSVRPDGARSAALEIAAPPSERARGFLEVEAGGEPRYSAPFELRNVEPSAVTLASLDVPGRDGRRLAPRSQSLEVVVGGEQALLPASLEVSIGSARYAATRDEARSAAERSLYRLDLDVVAWQDGPQPVQVRVEDVAGNVHAAAVELDLVLEPLRIESCGFGAGTATAGRWYLLAHEATELRVECNRVADLRWSVADSSGRVLRSGESEAGARTHRVALDPATFGADGFGGTLRVDLDERAWVAHAADSDTGAAGTELAFEIRRVGADFEVSLSGARARIDAEWNEPVHYAAAGALRAEILRAHDVPMTVSAEHALAGATARAAGTIAFSAPQDVRKALELTLAEDGCHRLVLEGRRVGADGRPFESADVRRELLVVRDTVAPAVTLVDWDDARVLRSRAELEETRALLRVDDALWTPEAPPAAVSWSLALRRADAEPSTSHGELALVPLVTTPWTLPIPAGNAEESPDGTYALLLRAQDFAGNLDVQGRTYTWSVSTEGPRLRVVAPLGGAPWARSDERFTVELRVEDANGVAAVRCAIVDLAGRLAPLSIELAPSRASAAGIGTWEGSFALDHRWSGRTVELRFEGTDALGTRTLEPLVVGCTVAPIPSLVPAEVEVTFRERATARMRRVPGNHGAAYLFGGRGDGLENSAFRASRLPDFATSALASSLRVEIPSGAIQDFYLDEHEVSVAQYLEFVRASDGYAAADAWIGAAPGEARRAELERVLVATAPELPVTGVTCDEARAFARWAGKELPTYLHWEYAVRGTAGRPFSFAGTAGAEEIASGGIGSAVNVASGAPWDVTRGSDRTPDTGILDLCSNVAEWTCTPDRGRLSDATAEDLLAPGASGAGGRHYAVGGSFARSTFHFGVVARAAQASPAIGFRCLLAAARVDEAFVGGAPDYTVVPAR